MTTDQTELYFDGKTYDPAKDKDRLKSLLGRVFDFMQDGQWHTLAEIHVSCGGTESSVSARLRDLRKQRFGSYQVFRRREQRGLWKYRLKTGHEPIDGKVVQGKEARKDFGLPDPGDSDMVDEYETHEDAA